MKRTHRKVRSGCDVCKSRRVKCDELRPSCSQCLRLAAACTYNSAKHATASAREQAGIMEITSHLSTAQHGWPQDLPELERRLLQHAAFISANIAATVRLGHVPGLVNFSRFLAIARHSTHVRHALCAVAAEHLRNLTQSASFTVCEHRNRALAMRFMVVGMQVLHRPSIAPASAYEELIASSTLLAWNAPCSREYKILIKGVSLLKIEARGLPANDHPEIEAVSVMTASDCEALLTALYTSVSLFSRCKMHANLKSAVRDLQYFLFNLRADSTPCFSVEAGLSALWPFRNAMRLVPEGIASLAENDFTFNLYLANHQALQFLVLVILPWEGKAAFQSDQRSHLMQMRKVIRAGLNAASNRIISDNRSSMCELQRLKVASEAWFKAIATCT